LYFHFPHFGEAKVVARHRFGILQDGNCRGGAGSVYFFIGKVQNSFGKIAFPNYAVWRYIRP
jgi:hypothetical protein